MFFGPPAASFLDAPSSLVLLFSDLQRPPTCGSHAHDASPEFRLHDVLSTSGQHSLDLKYSMGPKLYNRVTIFFAPHVPNFLAAPSSLALIFSDLQRPPTCCSHAQDASPEFKLHSVLSNSGQHCVDLSPMENYNFRCDPNFIIESPSSLVHMFQTFYRRHLLCFCCFPTCNNRLPVLRMHKTPHQNLGSIAFLKSTLARFEPHRKL